MRRLRCRRRANREVLAGLGASDTPFFYLGVNLWKRWFPEQVAAHDDLLDEG